LRKVADHRRAELIKAFAREKGLRLRSAQWNAKNETTGWKAWLAVQGGAAVKVVEFELADPTAPLKEGARRGRGRQVKEPVEFGDPAAVERAHWRLWQAAVDAAEATENAVVKAGLVRSAIEARKAYDEARKARIQAEIEARELLPAREFVEFRQRVAVICGLIERAGADIAPAGNPESPVLVIREWSRWLTEKFNPQVAELLAAA
jgi:hypothetical protein